MLPLSDGSSVRSRTVVVATGAEWRRLGVDSLEALQGRGVFYGAAVSEARAMTGKDVFVLGGGNSAGQAAVYLSRFARQVTILVRRASLAETMSTYLRTEIESTANIEVRTRVADRRRDRQPALWRRWCWRIWTAGARETVPADALFVHDRVGTAHRLPGRRGPPGPLGLHPDRAGPAGGDGRRGTSGRSPLMFETSLPGVFAIGDVRHGSVKRVASAVGAGAIVVAMVHEYLAGMSS